MWRTVLTDTEGNNRAFLQPHDLRITRRLNSHMSVSGAILTHEDSASEISLGDRAIKVYQDGVLRFRGKLSEPLVDDQDWCRFVAHDPFYFLARRRLQAATTFTATDAGAIAWSLINTQNGRSTTRIAQGTITTSVNRDRSYVEGDIVGTLITQLSEVDQGFYFVIDPVETDGVHGEIMVRWPDPGSSAAGALLGYGADTVGNLAGFQRIMRLPINRIRATGVIIGEQVLDSYAEDAASIAQYGLLEEERAFDSVSLQATLDQHALHDLEPTAHSQWQLSVAQDGDSGIFVPSLWTDFDVGDTVPFTIRHGRVDVSTTGVVASATVSVSDSGDSYRLESLLLMGED